MVGAIVCAGTSQSALTLTNVTALTSPKGVEFEIFESFAKSQSGPISVGGGGMGTARVVVVRLKSVSDPDSPDGKRPARSADFAPPKSFDPAQHLEVWDPEADQEVTGVDISRESNFKTFQSALQAQISTEPESPQQAISTGKISLDLNRFLKLSDKLNVVYRKSHYGSPSVAGSTS